MSNVRTTNRTESRIVSKPIKRELDFTAPIPSLTTSYIYFYSSAGRSAKVVAMNAYAVGPLGATSGSHGILFDDGTLLRYLEGISVFGSSILFDWNYWFLADSSQSPPTSVNQTLAMSLMRFSYTQVLRVSYANLTDVAQVTAPKIKLMVMEMAE